MSNISEAVGTTLKDKIGWRTGQIISYIVMGAFAVMTIYPIFWLIMNSFKPTPEFMQNRLGWPASWTLENYQGAWKLGNFTPKIINSIVYTALSTGGIILLSVMAGFAFAKIKSKATGIIYGSFLLGVMVTVTTLLIPLYILMSPRFTHLTNTYWGVLIVYIGVGLPIGIYLCTEFIKELPTALVESGRIDGAGYFRIFWSIILPMTSPVVMTLAILTIVATWNEFVLINIMVSSTDMQSLPVGMLMFTGPRASDYGKQFAALVVGMLPMLIFYIAFRKQITKGVAGGAVKE